MRRKRFLAHGRIASLALAAAAGYFVGSWNASALRGEQPSPAETVALRFPSGLDNAQAQQAPSDVHVYSVAAMTAGGSERELFNPQPFAAEPGAQRTAAAWSPVQVADAEPGAPLAVQADVPLPPPRVRERTTSIPISAAKPVVPHHPAHAGFVLDNAQIANIKSRLHLTPEQARMWPAVEVALRNIAVAREREVRRRGAPGPVDPNSAEAQDLKYAAIPLLMSFNDEQKDEVRNLARVMGLDRLASQF